LPESSPRRAELRQQSDSLLALHQDRWLAGLPAGVSDHIERGFLSRPLALAPGDSVDRDRLLRLSPTLFEVVGTIHRGWLTEVLEAQEIRPRGPVGKVALKRFRPPIHDPDVVERCRRVLEHELSTTRSVRHESIVEARGLALLEGEPALILEWLDGADLRSRLGRAWRPPGPAFAAAVGLALCRALACLAAQGIVHREVRPDHVVVTRTGRVKLIDLGWVRPDESVVGPDVGQLSPPRSLELDDYAFRYMSVEQARGETLDPRSDLFSLGSVLYALCTGRAPFAGGSQLETLTALVNEAIPLPSGAPDSLARVIRRALERDRERRYPDATSMAHDLEAVIQREGWQDHEWWRTDA